MTIEVERVAPTRWLESRSTQRIRGNAFHLPAVLHGWTCLARRGLDTLFRPGSASPATVKPGRPRLQVDLIHLCPEVFICGCPSVSLAICDERPRAGGTPEICHLVLPVVTMAQIQLG